MKTNESGFGKNGDVWQICVGGICSDGWRFSTYLKPSMKWLLVLFEFLFILLIFHQQIKVSFAHFFGGGDGNYSTCTIQPKDKHIIANKYGSNWYVSCS